MRAGLLALLLVALIQGESRADERITDGTAYTLEPGGIIFGPLRTGVGLPVPRGMSGLEFSTYPVPWAAFLASSDTVGVQFVNGIVKGSIDFGDRWTAALTLAALYGRVGDGGSSGRFLGLPFEAHVSYQAAPRLTVGGMAQFTYVSLAGRTVNESDDEEVERYSADGALRTNTAHLGVNAEFEATGWLSLIGEARVSRFGRVSADARGTYEVDEFTTVDVLGEASGSAAKWGYSTRVVTHMTFGWLNLRLGIGYGNYVLPMLNLAVPVRYVMPTLNLYLRF